MPDILPFLLKHIKPLERLNAFSQSENKLLAKWKWLFAPSLPALSFAIRTTVASLIALYLAMWMEMADPQWAAMTVWIVAQGSRGESLSKARWRLVGTAVGVTMAITLISSFIQQAWLFFPALGIWVGLCCTLATLVRNFRSYALVLAGYTCAIISIGSIQTPQNVFMIAMSRATYIVLGIVCESTIAGLFSSNLATTARRNIREKLHTALGSVSVSVAGLLSGSENAMIRSREMFGPLLSINDQIEFSEVEMGPHGHEGDHARAALAAVSVLLSRGPGMAVRLQYLDSDQPAFQKTAAQVSSFLNTVTQNLDTDEHVQELLHDLQHLRGECRQQIVDALTQEISTPNEEQSVEKVQALLDNRILHNALDELLLELEQAIKEYDASHHVIRGDHFHFRMQAHNDQREALYNGIRAFAAITAAGLIWEITAWPSGLTFITFVAIVCGLFATRENPVLASTHFLYGTLWAVAISAILVFIVIPPQADYETLAATFALPMIAGGLAARNAATALPSAAYTLLLPNFVAPSNHGRENELAWFNSTSSVILGIAFAIIVFKIVLPFDNASERWRMRRSMLNELRFLASAHPIPETRDWIGRNIDRFSRLIRHAGPKPSATIEGCLQGTLATMTIGLNIIRLRNLLARQQIPPQARRTIEVVMLRMERFTGKYDRTAQTAQRATNILRRLEATEPNITTRIELTRAIAYLIVVSHELRANAVFLDTSKPFKVR